MSDDIKQLHTWTIDLTREVDETTTETINGQPAQVTRKVKRPVGTRMCLKEATRRELKRAELFYGTEVGRFTTMGFLPRAVLANKYKDLTGGEISTFDRTRIAELSAKHYEIDQDQLRATTDEERKALQVKLAAVRNEMSSINAANEAAFSQTAEAKAQGQLGQWYAFNLIYIERNGKWTPYFEGDTFEKKEEFAWQLEEKADEFYLAAIAKILIYVHFYNMGASKPEQFKLIDEKLKEEHDAQVAKAKAEEAAKVAADKAAITKTLSSIDGAFKLPPDWKEGDRLPDEADRLPIDPSPAALTEQVPT